MMSPVPSVSVYCEVPSFGFCNFEKIRSEFDAVIIEVTCDVVLLDHLTCKMFVF